MTFVTKPAAAVSLAVRRALQRVRPWFAPRRVLRLLLRVLLLWVLLLPVLGLIVHLYGQTDQTQTADVIIVLGAGLRADNTPGPALTRRSHHAAELWKQGFAPAIICTGGMPGRATRSEADACAELLRAQGVPETAIVLEGESRSTEENALQTRTLMQEQGWRTALLVTDGFHMLRAEWIFRSEGIAIYTSPVHDEQPGFIEYLLQISREVLALHWQAFKQFFNLPITYVKSL